MEIIALQEYTDKYISLYQGQIRNLNKELAQRLIEQGIVRQHDNIDDNSGNQDIIKTISVVEQYSGTTSEFEGAYWFDGSLNYNKNLLSSESDLNKTFIFTVDGVEYRSESAEEFYQYASLNSEDMTPGPNGFLITFETGAFGGGAAEVVFSEPGEHSVKVDVVKQDPVVHYLKIYDAGTQTDPEYRYSFIDENKEGFHPSEHLGEYVYINYYGNNWLLTQCIEGTTEMGGETRTTYVNTGGVCKINDGVYYVSLLYYMGDKTNAIHFNYYKLVMEIDQ